MSLFKKEEFVEMICFHHNDLDGRAAAAVVNWAFEHINEKLLFVEVNYKDSFPYDMISKNESVWLVDYSLKLDGMLKLYAITKNVIIIDHHKTAVDMMNELEEKIPEGLVKDLFNIQSLVRSGVSACELTWDYLYHCVRPMPRALKWIGDRDVWKWEYLETKAFTAGMMIEDQDPKSHIWKILLAGGKPEASKVQQIISNGEVCLKFIEKQRAQIREANMFEARLDGQRCLALNVGYPVFSSELFGEELKDYPFGVGFSFDGTTYTYQLRSEKNPETSQQIDVSEIAKKHGGGGHLGSAGFFSKEFLIESSSNPISG